MKRIKYAIFLLCSFAVLISLSGCRKSSENIKNIRFPTKYQKNYKNRKMISVERINESPQAHICKKEVP